MATAVDNPAVQRWIETSSNSFARSLRQQQLRGFTLTERQIAAAANIVGVLQQQERFTNLFLGAEGQVFELSIIKVSEFTSKNGKLVTKYTAAGRELVVFGEHTATKRFKIVKRDEYNGRKSCVIKFLEAEPLICEIPTAAEVLERFRLPSTPPAPAAAVTRSRIKPVVNPDSATPFADFARQLRGGAA